jgi:hypothetical protein
MCHAMCLLSTVQGLVRIQQSTLNRYWHAFTFCTVGLSQEGLRQKINPISCSLLVVCRLWDRWQATSHILFLQSKPICTALWFTAHITVCELMCLQVKAITEMPLTSQQVPTAPYVRPDVSSEYSDQWMTYYTWNSKMAAPLYVCADVSWD